MSETTNFDNTIVKKGNSLSNGLISILYSSGGIGKNLRDKLGFDEGGDNQFQLSGRNSEEEILHILGGTEFRHGTGRLRYSGNQYENGSSNIVGIFEEIIQNGLKPQYDPINKAILNSDQEETTSLTKNRMYARCYAEQYNSEELDHVFGHRRYWISGYIAFTSLTVIDGSLLRKASRIKFGRLIERLSKIFGIEKVITEDTLPGDKRLLKNRKSDLSGNWQKYWISGLSDITGNHGIIIGTKKYRIPTINIGNKGVGLFEYRTSDTIDTDDILYIEVPEKFVGSVFALLDKYSLKIPVLSIEDVEKTIQDNYTVKTLSLPR